MAKQSGGTRTQGGSSKTKGFSLASDGKKLGIQSGVLSLFAKADSYGNFRNAPQSFRQSFDRDASQQILTAFNKAQEKAVSVRDAKVRQSFSGGGQSMFESAMSEYNSTMSKINSFVDKLRDIQRKFNS